MSISMWGPKNRLHWPSLWRMMQLSPRKNTLSSYIHRTREIAGWFDFTLLSTEGMYITFQLSIFHFRHIIYLLEIVVINGNGYDNLFIFFISDHTKNI